MMNSLLAYLKNKLSQGELEKVTKSFDIIGDIAIIKVPDDLRSRKELIAKAVMLSNKKVKTVLNQLSPVSGPFRLRTLEHVLGDRKTDTYYKEYGCIFRVDLAEVYFSPRLSYERMRISRLIREGESIINMFAGVGCYSILIAKHSRPKVIYSIDLNPNAVQLMKENIFLNKVEPWVKAIEGDAKEVIEAQLLNSVDRVLMPLPEKAFEYLETAINAIKTGGGFVHYYDCIHAKKGVDPIRSLVNKVSKKFSELQVTFEISSSRIVRMVGPRWYQLVLDIRVF